MRENSPNSPDAPRPAQAGPLPPTTSAGGRNSDAQPPPPSAASPLGELIERLRTGDRQAAGQFIERYGPMVRRRVRGKLGESMRRMFDSQDILSTVSRRLDRYAAAGKIRATSEPELWKLVLRMVDSAMVDKFRLVRRLRRAEGDDPELSRLLLRRFESPSPEDEEAAERSLDRAFASLGQTDDRQFLSLWLRGHRHATIAGVLGISPEAARQRWLVIRDLLRAEFEREEPKAVPGLPFIDRGLRKPRA